MIINILIALLSGVVASIMSFIFLRCIKARVAISSKIWQNCKSGSDASTFYIKIVNNSYSYLKNIDYSLCLLEHSYVDFDKNGQKDVLIQVTTLEMHLEKLRCISPKSFNDNGEYANCILLSFTIEDQTSAVQEKLKNFIENSNQQNRFYLEFSFYAENTFSDGTLFKRQHYPASSITTQAFVAGNSVDSVKQNIGS